MRKSAMFNLLGLVIAWLVVFGAFTLLVKGSSFASRDNFEALARQTTTVALGALGMTYIIISGGIDLSVGSVVAFVTVVIAWLIQAGQSPIVALLGGVAAGGLCGLANGFLVTRLKVGPFIVTLGSLLVFRGLAKGLAHEQKIDAKLTWLNDLLAKLSPDKRWMLVPIGVWATLLLAILVAQVLRGTTFGRYVVAVGSNEQAARYAGISVSRIRLAVYVLGGLFAGLAGVMQFSRLTVGDPTVAVGLELDVIAAVVIGGASLSGGQGSVAGALLGALIMSTIRAGCSQMGLPNWVQEIVTGSIIVLAVALDRVRVNRAGREST